MLLRITAIFVILSAATFASLTCHPERSEGSSFFARAVSAWDAGEDLVFRAFKIT